MRDALELCREIYKLIRFSPKRSHLFSTMLETGDDSRIVGLKPMCPTRCTVRTASIDAVIKDYTILMDTLEEVNSTTHDEYGLKAGGLLHALEVFSTLFGLKLAHLLFSVAEQVSSTLQSKDITLKESLVSVSTAKKFYLRIRADNEFEHFYSSTTQLASKYGVSAPVLQ